MPNTAPKTSQDMPIWARLLAVALGAGLLLLGLVGFLIVRPLDWKLVLAAIASVGLACDLLCGALRGQWPIFALFWLVP